MSQVQIQSASRFEVRSWAAFTPEERQTVLNRLYRRVNPVLAPEPVTPEVPEDTSGVEDTPIDDALMDQIKDYLQQRGQPAHLTQIIKYVEATWQEDFYRSLAAICEDYAIEIVIDAQVPTDDINRYGLWARQRPLGYRGRGRRKRTVELASAAFRGAAIRYAQIKVTLLTEPCRQG